MTLRGVPWAIGQDGAKIPPEVARLLAYVATGGHEGVGGPGDLAVLPTAVPSGQVQVMPGAYAVLNRAPSSSQQTYMDSQPDETLVTVSATSSSGGRTDLIYVEVDDSQYTGVPAPANTAIGPYDFIKVIEGVASTVTKLSDVDPTKTGYALARITRPASKGIVESGDITDLRQLAQPRRDPQQYILNVANGSADKTLTKDAAWHNFPPDGTWQVPVPAWATHAQVTVFLDGIMLTGSAGDNGTGQFRVQLGGVNSAAVDYNEGISGAKETMAKTIGQTFAVAKAQRGTTQTLLVQAFENTADHAAVKQTGGTVIVANVVFYEAPDPNAWS